MKHCPHCKQVLRSEWRGLPMSPLKVSILDYIARSGTAGVNCHDVFNHCYDGRKAKILVVKSHVHQINDMLEETDWTIRCDGRGRFARWFLARRGNLRTVDSPSLRIA